MSQDIRKSRSARPLIGSFLIAVGVAFLVLGPMLGRSMEKIYDEDEDRWRNPGPQVMAVLISTGIGMIVFGVAFRRTNPSPRTAAPLQCRKCKAINNLGAQFCRQCGQGL
jgi:uncharacterized membrane protein YidH (DUF202 family)